MTRASAPTAWSEEDHTARVDRLDALAVTRVLVALATFAGAGVLLDRAGVAVLAAGGCALLAMALDVGARRRARAGTAVTERELTAVLLLDGLSLVLVVHAVDGPAGPLPTLLVLRAVADALLLSHRLALRSAAWVTVLVSASATVRALEGTVPASAGGRELVGVVGVLLAVWGATALTTGATSVNVRALRRDRLEQRVHASFGIAAEEARGPADIADALATHILRLGGVEDVVVLDLRDLPLVIGTSGGASAGSTPTDGPGTLLDAVRTTRDQVTHRAGDDDRDGALLELLHRPPAVTGVPMVAGDDVVGAVVVTHTSSSRSTQRRTVGDLRRLVAHGAMALANAWARQALDRQARTDGLTGVANRRVFDEALRVEVDRARRDGAPLSLILCDVDHFKRFNDDHGHQEGDRVLADVAAALQANRRPYDLVARYGGEEFAVVLPRTGLDAALAVARRLRAEVAASRLDHTVTASFGVGTTVDGHASADDLLTTADRWLYDAKEAGRDTVRGGHASAGERRLGTLRRPRPAIQPEGAPAG